MCCVCFPSCLCAQGWQYPWKLTSSQSTSKRSLSIPRCIVHSGVQTGSCFHFSVSYADMIERRGGFHFECKCLWVKSLFQPSKGKPGGRSALHSCDTYSICRQLKTGKIAWRSIWKWKRLWAIKATSSETSIKILTGIEKYGSVSFCRKSPIWFPGVGTHLGKWISWITVLKSRVLYVLELLWEWCEEERDDNYSAFSSPFTWGPFWF